MSSSTTNYNLYKPDPNQANVAGNLNNNLDTIDSLIKQLNDTKASLTALNGKADAVHSHNDYALTTTLDEIATVVDEITTNVENLQENKLDKSEFLNLNEIITNKTPTISINGSSSNSAMVTVVASLDSSAPILRWTFWVSSSANALGFTVSQNSPILTFNKGDTESTLNITVRATNPIGNTTTNEATASANISPYTGPPFIINTLNRLDEILTNELTVERILDAIAQDSDVMQAQANVLQHSNILLEKLA
ncbi:MAG: hypothetical protein PHY08_14450, partial [Candidatus Cloacimonetes bacterium]|nr:hypothetical protein [Candidatus Cloacimonadota bacterium]